MSFIKREAEKGKNYAPGAFLAHEECTRVTKQIPQTGATTADNGGKYHKMGEIFPANDATAIGILYEDVDVTYGDMPGSVVTKGEVYESMLPVAPATAAKTALQAAGIKFVTKPTNFTRPY